MSLTSSVFETAKVRVQNRSTFNMSHENFLSMKIGKLIPVLTEKVIPGDKVTLKQLSNIKLAPLATNFFGRVDFCVEAFFVPNRILFAGWRDFMLFNGGLATSYNPYGVEKMYLPYITSSSELVNPFEVGSLGDYLGVQPFPDDGTQGEISSARIDSLPFLAYCKIWDDFYRDKRIQQSLFAAPAQNSKYRAAFAPFQRTGVAVAYDVADVTNKSAYMYDGSLITDLRSRNYAKDYFTSAELYQNGGSTQLKVQVPVTDDEGYFTIQELRAANSLQRFAEVNALAGGDYPTLIKALYGVVPSDANIDRPIYLGSYRSPLYKNSVAQTNDNIGTPSVSPFEGQLGNMGANSQTSAKGNLINGFEVKEHGFIMVLASIVPHANYSSGTRKYLNLENIGGSDVKFTDYAPVPMLAGVGNEPVYNSELSFSWNTNYRKQVFGWTERYASYKYHSDETHGLLRYGEDLQAFALHRAFANPSLTSTFLAIPESSLDNVTAVAATLSQYGAQVDIYNELIMTRPLPVYSIPTLGEPLDTHSETISKGGRRF